MIVSQEFKVTQAGVDFQVRIPGQPLACWVDSYWVSEGKPLYNSERILADGTSTLIFNFGAPIRTHLGGSKPEERSSFFAGVNSRFADVFHGGDRSQAGIRFKTGGTYLFLQQPLSEFNDLAVDTDLLGRPDINELLDALGSAAGAAAQLDLLETWMLRCLCKGQPADPRLGAALHYMSQEPGLRVEHLADRLGCSRQYLNRLFHLYAGSSPKSLQRTLRIGYALRQLRPGKTADWIGLAEQGSFFDQSHLIHEFQHMTGFSPSAYQEELDRRVGRMILR
ncbi:MAG: AraC family transcriptional regulator [Bacteroidetes bacterium]|nr:MAG: AraC family transcriptional regulator [Bacteroidota bacterium]